MISKQNINDDKCSSYIRKQNVTVPYGIAVPVHIDEGKKEVEEEEEQQILIYCESSSSSITTTSSSSSSYSDDDNISNLEYYFICDENDNEYIIASSSSSQQHQQPHKQQQQQYTDTLISIIISWLFKSFEHFMLCVLLFLVIMGRIDPKIVHHHDRDRHRYNNNNNIDNNQGKKQEMMMEEKTRLKQLLNDKNNEIVSLQQEINGLLQDEINWMYKKNTIETEIIEAATDTEQIKYNIQQMSKIMLLEKYGPGPHYVEVQVQFSNNNDSTRHNEQQQQEEEQEQKEEEEEEADNSSFVIELAPIDVMPHTVYWFLQQVEQNFYNNGSYSFDINAEHIIQAGLTSSSVSLSSSSSSTSSSQHTATAKEEEEEETTLPYSKVLFPEYSKEFPHVPYTLGFPADKEWSNNLYISMKDNTKINGPPNDNDDNDDEQPQKLEADPCFAKVIEGFETIDRIHASETIYSNDEEEDVMKYPVSIQSMKLIQR